MGNDLVKRSIFWSRLGPPICGFPNSCSQPDHVADVCQKHDWKSSVTKVTKNKNELSEILRRKGYQKKWWAIFCSTLFAFASLVGSMCHGRGFWLPTFACIERMGTNSHIVLSWYAMWSNVSLAEPATKLWHPIISNDFIPDVSVNNRAWRANLQRMSLEQKHMSQQTGLQRDLSQRTHLPGWRSVNFAFGNWRNWQTWLNMNAVNLAVSI